MSFINRREQDGPAYCEKVIGGIAPTLEGVDEQWTKAVPRRYSVSIKRARPDQSGPYVWRSVPKSEEPISSKIARKFRFALGDFPDEA